MKKMLVFNVALLSVSSCWGMDIFTKGLSNGETPYHHILTLAEQGESHAYGNFGQQSELEIAHVELVTAIDLLTTNDPRESGAFFDLPTVKVATIKSLKAVLWTLSSLSSYGAPGMDPSEIASYLRLARQKGMSQPEIRECLSQNFRPREMDKLFECPHRKDFPHKDSPAFLKAIFSADVTLIEATAKQMRDTVRQTALEKVLKALKTEK